MRGVIFATKLGSFTAITRIMKTISNSHQKFYYVAYCFCPSQLFKLRGKKKLNKVFVCIMSIGRLKNFSGFIVTIIFFFFYLLLVVGVMAVWSY